jgi:uncharacterized protein YdhG (YjbR/CyaY superfamily)
MAKRAFQSVDEYLAAQPPSAQRVLKSVRRAIRTALPRAEEAVSYGIPAYKVDGRLVIYFAGWKQHYSLYPAPPAVVAAFKDDLAPYRVNQGTIRFPLDGAVPANLIGRIAKFRAKEVSLRAKRTAPAPRRR